MQSDRMIICCDTDWLNDLLIELPDFIWHRAHVIGQLFKTADVLNLIRLLTLLLKSFADVTRLSSNNKGHT